VSSDAYTVAKALTFDFIFAFSINQAVICWLLSAESEIRYQGMSDGGGEQSYTKTDSSPTTSVLPCPHSAIAISINYLDII
jgi:hypothetical protein